LLLEAFRRRARRTFKIRSFRKAVCKPIEDLITERTRGNDSVGRMDRTQYAEYVVGEIIKGKSGKIWQGTNASAERFGSSGVAQSMIVSFAAIWQLIAIVLTWFM
jgi:hypothetical protein